MALMLSETVMFDWMEMTGLDITSEAFLPSILIWDLSASEIDFIVLNEGSTRPDSSLAIRDWLTPAALASSDWVIPSWTLIFFSCFGSMVDTDKTPPGRSYSAYESLLGYFMKGCREALPGPP